MGDSRHKAYFYLLLEAEVVDKEGEGNRAERSRERVAKFSVCRLAQSIPNKAGDDPVYIILD